MVSKFRKDDGCRYDGKCKRKEKSRHKCGQQPSFSDDGDYVVQDTDANDPDGDEYADRHKKQISKEILVWATARGFGV